MKKRILLHIIFFTWVFSIYGQSFDFLTEHFKQQIPVQDSITLPLIYKGAEYDIAISQNPIPFNIKELVLKPIENEEYPISFSVIFRDRLISLFTSGKFICYTIPSLDRDKDLEAALNTKKMQYQWIIENKLVGFTKGKYYYFDSTNKWVNYSKPIPIKQQPILFEDSTFISFRDCHGEWGGTVYFYNKESKKVYFTEATCANSIIKKENNYFVLSHLGHGLGTSNLKVISNPNLLPSTEPKDINKTVNGEALGYMDKSNISKQIFDYYDIQIFSSFIYQGKTLYIVYWKETTFLAEINNNIIKIVHPLFNKELYTHEPVTTSYGDWILINLDFYGIAKEKEISCIIIKDNQLIKIDWNEKHDN